MTTAQAHREPPMPPWFAPARRGFCRWCGEPVSEGRRYHWHGACVAAYNALVDEMRQPNQALAERQGGLCAACGEPLGAWDNAWQDDHVIALVDALPHADDPWWPWRLANRQGLCLVCHVAKTAEENVRRAKWRRAFRVIKSGQMGMF